MHTEQQTAYDELKQKLRIDTLRLTEELVELPQYQSEVTDWLATAQHARDAAKDIADIAKAEVSARMRNVSPVVKPPSEERIKSEVLIDAEVQQAMAHLRDTEFDLALWKGLADSARAKNGALRAIADLIQSGYASPTSLYSERKREMAKVRQQQS